MKLHHIFGAACVLGGTLALSSCEKYDELFPAQYHCVLNIKDAGIRNTELYTTEAEGTTPVSIMKTGSKGMYPPTEHLSRWPQKLSRPIAPTTR